MLGSSIAVDINVSKVSLSRIPIRFCLQTSLRGSSVSGNRRTQVRTPETPRCQVIQVRSRISEISGTQAATTSVQQPAMSFRPILYHYFRTPLPHTQTLALFIRAHTPNTAFTSSRTKTQGHPTLATAPTGLHSWQTTASNRSGNSG